MEVDIRRFLAIAGPAPADADELASFFVTYLSEQLRALRAGLDAGQAGVVELVAHRLAGSCATYGMHELAPLLAEIERHAHDGRLSDAAGLEDQVRAASSSIRSALSGLGTRAQAREEEEAP